MPDSLHDLKIVFAGSGAFGLPTLRRLIDRGATIAHVYTQPDKPAGRGKAMTPTPIGAFAAEHGLPLMPTPDINVEPLPPADLMIVIAFGQKIAPRLVNHARFGAINLHASRLPRYRGAAPINWAVINGDETAGNSVIRLADKMDAGAVLAMSELPIGELETAGELHDRLADDGADLVERVALTLRDGTTTPIEQDHARATKAIKLSRELTQIDWTREAGAVANQIRGMHPWPGVRVRLLDSQDKELDRMTLVRARSAGSSERTRQHDGGGTINEHGFVRCASSMLEIVELQPDGKRPMPLAPYRNGRRWDAGMRLESIR